MLKGNKEGESKFAKENEKLNICLSSLRKSLKETQIELFESNKKVIKISK